MTPSSLTKALVLLKENEVAESPSLFFSSSEEAERFINALLTAKEATNVAEPE
jgi:hypothetical protein